MGVAEILHEIETLPSEERWKVLEHTRELLEREIPESFKLAMREIKRGEVIELDEALKELDLPGVWSVDIGTHAIYRG